MLTHEHDPALAQAAMAALLDSPQRWAVGAAQLELEARRLEGCTDLGRIAAAYEALGFEGMDGPLAPLVAFARVSRDVAAAARQRSPFNQRLTLQAAADQLEALLRDLLLRADRPAARLRPIAAGWLELLRGAIAESLRQVRARGLIESPYVVGLPLGAEQAVFVGRTDVAARIERLLLTPHRPPLLLYGERRLGKTSLLHNLVRLLPQQTIPLLIDLQGAVSRTRDHVGFLHELAAALSEQLLLRRQLSFAAPALARLAEDPFPVFERWLQAVGAALGDHTLLLCLDEFEQLEEALQEDRLQHRAVLGMFRHLIQHHPRFRVLLAGAHTLDETRVWSSHLINVQTLRLGVLEPGEARQLVEEPVRDFPLAYAPEALDRVLSLTGRHPYLLQLLCDQIIARKNDQPPPERRRVQAADVEAALPEAMQLGDLFFADIEGNQLDGPAVELARLLAAQGRPCTQRECADRLGEDPGPALARLLARETAEEVDGGYRIRIEMVRRWFAGAPRRP